MGLRDWFRRPQPTYADPTFGLLTYDHASWSGLVVFPPTGEEAAIILESDGAEPSELYGRMFAELALRYPSLTPAIGAALFDLWKPWLDQWPDDRPPRAASAETLLGLTALDSIILGLPSRVRLCYGFADAGVWDAVFTVELTDWRISGNSLDD